MEQTPSNEQIRTIVKKALLAPSGDNCQPWSFSWDGKALWVRHLSDRAEHPLDPKGATSILTLGCLLESVVIAASEFRLATLYKLGDLDPSSTEPWVEIRFTRSSIAVDPMAAMIEARCTDRRMYDRGPFPSEVLLEIAAQQRPLRKAELHFVETFPETLVEYILKSEEKLVEHPTALPAILKWVRFSSSALQKTGDGICWRNLEAKFWELPLVALLRQSPASLRFLRGRMISQFRNRANEQLHSSAGLICVSIPDAGNPVESAVEAGRLMMRVWLSLTKLGYGVQPLTFASVPFLYKKFGVLDSFFAENSDFLNHGEAVLREAFLIPDGRIPVWIIRTGKIDALPQRLRTPRRPLEDVLQFL